ncbi:tRNA (adenosine(37)-N6)-threonylcarbamoyltransferase complex ATPase subunit type 1 TsaE [Bacteroidetes bacterium SCGC AAA795-G10]|nr:tRNA (adenosine(37)-N6)-threonylcarbamoyltransferase complex ATPase subunit type 1 TsaE [Bacteroidetes bacterium SCGC AAA795-G10]
MEYVYNLANINKASKLVIDNIKTSVVRIDGKMGAGKTKIISNICMQLGVKEVITSPTFSLINTYQSTNGPIYHFDFYRLQNSNEALDIGIEEYLESGNVCFLEWAEKIENHLPLNYDHYILKVVNDNTRRIFSLER